jgi:hypothetical protein
MKEACRDSRISPSHFPKNVTFIPNSTIERIEKSAFGVYSVLSIIFSNLRLNICDKPFVQDRYLTELRFGDYVAVIGRSIFAEIHFREVTFTDPLKLIGEGVFGDSSLGRVTLAPGPEVISADGFCVTPITWIFPLLDSLQRLDSSTSGGRFVR